MKTLAQSSCGDALLNKKEQFRMKLALFFVWLFCFFYSRQPEKNVQSLQRVAPTVTRSQDLPDESRPMAQQSSNDTQITKVDNWRMTLALWLTWLRQQFRQPEKPHSPKKHMNHSVKQLHHTSFWESLMIQKRVIGALLMREIITRYGRANIGFLWLFVEPLMMTMFIVLMWKFFRADHFSSLNIVAFVLTGYPMVMMWRNASNRAIGAIAANQSLLYHRNVRVLDTLISRMLLEISGATIAQIGIMAVMVLIDWMPFPDDVFYMMLAWLMMSIFAFGLGLIICAIAYRFEVFGKIWGTLSFVMMPLSGTFFFVHSLPQQAQEVMLTLPIVHGTEMFRKGYFGAEAITYESPVYLMFCNLVLLWFGLMMIRQVSKGVEPS